MTDKLERNNLGRLSINKTETKYGEIEIPVFDERFTMDDFTYVVDVGFKDLQTAVSAEDYVLRAYANNFEDVKMQNTELSIEEVDQITAKSFFSQLSNLVNSNENSLAGLRYQIERLRQTNEYADENVRQKNEQIVEQTIEIEDKNAIIARQDSEIQILKQSLETLANATTSSMKQIEELTKQQTTQLVNAMQIINNNPSGSL
jgi:chromosome segregation ATPase